MRWVLLTVLAAQVLSPFGGSAHRRTEKGNQRYLEGNLEEALRLYTEAQVDAPQAAELYYDIGNVLYRQEAFEDAAEAYSRAMLMASPELEGPAAYNLGNAHFRQEAFEDAIKAYERALRADPRDLDAKRNLELALEAVEEQQQQQQQQQQEDQDQGDQEEEQESSGEEEQPQQEPGESGDESTPEGGSESEGDQEPQKREQRPGEMTAEQAERLLDGLQEQELENLRDQALEKRRASTKTSGEDW